jgi:6-pyruvoyltetrahydropterin/6-carboxytetrahydropterin synthase
MAGLFRAQGAQRDLRKIRDGNRLTMPDRRRAARRIANRATVAYEVETLRAAVPAKLFLNQRRCHIILERRGDWRIEPNRMVLTPPDRKPVEIKIAERTQSQDSAISATRPAIAERTQSQELDKVATSPPPSRPVTIPPMFRLTRQVRFALPAPGQPVPAGAVNGHAGHPALTGVGTFLSLDATLAGELEPSTSYLRNIKEIDDVVRRRAIPFIADFIARHSPQAIGRLMLELFDQLKDGWPGASLDRLVLHLSPFLSAAVCSSEMPMTRLSQKFEFSASHRLHNPALSDEENRRCFGKCNNPHGHGHNYELQVTLRGTPDAQGLIIDIPQFQETVARTVIDRFDHKNLNLEVSEFRDLNPSVENIAMVIFRLLKPRFASFGAQLASVTVWETPKTWAEFSE